MTKFCPKCNCTKSLDSFGNQPSTTDGLRPWCKQCMAGYSKQWRSDNKEKKAANDLRWRNENKDRMKTTLREYYLAHKDDIVSMNKTWADAHPDKVKKAKADWAVRNIDYVREKGRAYWKNNPEKAKIMVQNRRARRLSSGLKLSYGIVKKVLAEQGDKCPGCLCDLTTNKRHIDHFMPLSLGGQHCDNNIQILCATCNMKKGSKHPMTWMNTLSKPTNVV